MKDFTLPILFLTQSVTGDSPTQANNDKNLHQQKVSQTFSVITRVLTQCHHFKESVARVLVPVISRYGMHDVFIRERERKRGRLSE